MRQERRKPAQLTAASADRQRRPPFCSRHFVDPTYAAGKLLLEAGGRDAGKVHDDFLGVLRLARPALPAVGPVTSQ